MTINSLKDKLSRFNPQRPFIWELRINNDEFSLLDENIRESDLDLNKKEDALKVLIYLAEWYKRHYTNRIQTGYLNVFHGTRPDLERIWDVLNINRDYLYQSKDGRNLYLHSTFILSGLAVKFELQRNETSFLIKLCRIFNSSEDKQFTDDPFESIVDRSHSIAFGCSMGTRGHCLREFFNAIVNSDNWPYAQEDIENEDTLINALITKIRKINDDVKRSKFRLEWIFNVPSGDDLITRHLRLWLNPEENDGEKRHLLRHHWIEEKWGLENPGELRYICIGLKYYMDEHLIQEADQHRPEMMFRNTGNAEVGFIADVADYSICKRVPVIQFNKVVIVCWDKEGVEHEIITEEANFDAKQLYRIDKFEDIWTDRTSPQKETALLFSKKYSIAEISKDKVFEIKSFYNKKYGQGDCISWCPINVSVVLQDINGKCTDPFLNKQGFSQIITKLYHQTIRYNEEGHLAWRHIDKEDDSEQTETISLIYQKEDINVRFSNRRDNNDVEEIEQEIIGPDNISFKGEKGVFIEWDEDHQPLPGVNYIRVYARDRLINKDGKPYPVFYLPGGITRDCRNHIISYNDKSKDCSSDIEDSIKRKVALQPCVEISIHINSDIIDVPVYQPTLIKEVCYDGKIVEYIDNGDITIPYIQKDHLQIHDFSENGYVSYQCGHLNGLHHHIFSIRTNNRNSAWASSAAWEKGDTYQAQSLDPYAPACLKIKLGDCRQARIESESSFYFWNYDSQNDEEGIRNRILSAPEQWGLIFESMRNSKSLHNHYPLMNEEDDDVDFWDDDGDGSDHYANVDVMKCFNVALKHNLYFFTFTPLKNLSNEQFRSQLVEPILFSQEKTGEQLKGLLRFSDEFGFEELKDEIITELSKIQAI